MKPINVNPHTFIRALALAALVTLTAGCGGYLQSNNLSQMVYGLFFTTSPVLNALVLSGTSSTSITLDQPTLASSGNPYPTVQAYIGDSNLITVTGSTVGGIIDEGPVDVSAGPYTFNGLMGNTTYRIFVVAYNSSGYSVRWIDQNTGGIAPVMDPLIITASDYESITLQQPTFSTAGNPLPPTQSRLAYIGMMAVLHPYRWTIPPAW